MELDDYSYDQKLDIFHELIFTIDLKYIDCDDCDIEIDSLADTIKNYNDKIINGSRFEVTSKLDIVNGNTTRGVLLSEITYKFSEIQKLSFGLFIDPNNNF
jgi:GTPase involved in cell partitioning and DNA repair